MVYARDHGGTRNVSVPRRVRERFCIDDADVLKLADYAIRIEDTTRQMPVISCRWTLNGPRTLMMGSSM
jgi:phosphoenolpyruvate synthase/pyruvate phosphate dikinase